MNELTIKSSWTNEELQLVKNTVAPNATEKEFQLFAYRCKELGLNPLKPGQIHFVKYGSSPGTIVVGIDGLRALSARSGKLSGIKRGPIKDSEGKLVGAWAEIYRSDWSQPARNEVSLSEYNTGRAMWAKMPETMICKVAEAGAHRMAFPDLAGGVYATEEMDQASNKGKILPEEPPPEMQRSLGYTIGIGRFAGRSMEEVGPEEISRYVSSLEARAEKSGQSIESWGIKWGEFYERAKHFIHSFSLQEEANAELQRAEDELLRK